VIADEEPLDDGRDSDADVPGEPPIGHMRPDPLNDDGSGLT